MYPSELRDLVMSMMWLDPHERPSAEELVIKLEEYLKA